MTAQYVEPQEVVGSRCIVWNPAHFEILDLKVTEA